MLFLGQKRSICPQQIFFGKLYHSYLPISSSGSRVMRMCNFWAKNDPFPQMRIFFRKPVNELCFFHSCLSTCQKSKSDNKQFLPITWEPDFSQACSFRRMLMNHKNFHFTQIPDKTNDVILLKSLKTLFLDHFWKFLVIFAQWGFFPKNLVLSHITRYKSLTLC